MLLRYLEVVLFFVAGAHWNVHHVSANSHGEPTCNSNSGDKSKCSADATHDVVSQTIALLTAASKTLSSWKKWEEMPMDITALDEITAFANPGKVGSLLKQMYKEATSKSEKQRLKAWYRNWEGSKLHLVHIAQAAVQEHLGNDDASLQLYRTAADAARKGRFWGKQAVPCRGPPPMLLETVPACWEDTWCEYGISQADITKKHQEVIVPAVRLTLQLHGLEAATNLLQSMRDALPGAVPWKSPQQLPFDYHPALEAQPIWDASTDDDQWRWLAHIEQLAPEIQSNLSRLLTTREYQQWTLSGDWRIVDPSSPDRGWSEWLLFDAGRWNKDACTAFADVCKLFAAVPQVSGVILDPRRSLKETSGQDLINGFLGGQVTILRLRAGARLKPHYGISNVRLTGHLGIVIPEGAFLQVAGRQVQWKSGKVIVFDDSYHHEAWNNGLEDRFVLYFSMWHPGTQASPQLIPPDFYAAKFRRWHPLSR